MAKCKHKWRIYTRNITCVKCKCNILQAYNDQKKLIIELENKMGKIFQISTSLASYPQNERLRDIVDVCQKRAELLAGEK